MPITRTDIEFGVPPRSQSEGWDFRTFAVHRVLPESDGPFGLIDNRPLFPWEAWAVVPLPAQLWRDTEAQVEHQLQVNFKKVVG